MGYETKKPLEIPAAFFIRSLRYFFRLGTERNEKAGFRQLNPLSPEVSSRFELE